MQGRERKLERGLTPAVAPEEPCVSRAAPALPDEAGCSAVLWFWELFTDFTCFPVLFKQGGFLSLATQGAWHWGEWSGSPYAFFVKTRHDRPLSQHAYALSLALMPTAEMN